MYKSKKNFHLSESNSLLGEPRGQILKVILHLFLVRDPLRYMEVMNTTYDVIGHNAEINLHKEGAGTARG